MRDTPEMTREERDRNPVRSTIGELLEVLQVVIALIVGVFLMLGMAFYEVIRLAVNWAKGENE